MYALVDSLLYRKPNTGILREPKFAIPTVAAVEQ